MSTLQILKINAVYEVKILSRSWFFRIFAVLSILILTGLDVLFYSSVAPAPRFFRGLDSFLPYMNIMFPQFILIIVVVFLTSDIYKRDSRLNTSDVIHIRSMSNFGFIFGRVSGIISLFLLLDLIYLMVAAIINILFSDLSFVWQAYLLYPLLIALPSLVFTIGLTLLLMYIIRNQPVVIILVIGLLAGSIFYFSNYQYLLFDIPGAKFPFAFSDFYGLAHSNLTILQRGGWLLSGTWMILMAVLLFKRLPQAGLSRNILYLCAFLLPLLAGVFFYSYHLYYSDGADLRKEANSQIASFTADVEVTNYNLNVDYNDGRLSIHSFLKFKNIMDTTVDRVKLFLNPGFTINRITSLQKELSFRRSGILLEISLNKILQAGQNDSLDIVYDGTVDGRIMYPEIAEKDRVLSNYFWLFRSSAVFALSKPDYLLLAPSSYWYPQSIPSSTRDILKPFAQFSLLVKTAGNLTAISQGKVENQNPGEFRFHNDRPLKEISLIIGKYQHESLMADSLEINFYRHPDHNFYKAFFKTLNDTLPAVIKEVLQDFETKIDLSYPFHRLTFVEVPIHLFAYRQNNRTNSMFLQAEQVWIPENGASLTSTYFKMMKQRQQHFGGHSNQTFTEQEKEIILFKQFAKNTFTGDGRFGFGNVVSFTPDLNIYPQFLNFSFGQINTQNDGFAIALENNIKQLAVSQGPERHWMIGSLTAAEEANLALEKAGVDSILKYASDDLKNKVLMVKGSYLLKKLESRLGKENYNRFIKNIILKNRFKMVPLNYISDILTKQDNFDLQDALQHWYKDKKLPGFLIGSPVLYQVRDGDRLRYQVIFDVSNPSDVDGLIEVNFRYPGERRNRFMMEEDNDSEKWLFNISKGKTEHIGLVLDAEPRSIQINTLVSQNLPAIISYGFEDAELKPFKQPFSGAEETDWKNDAFSNNSKDNLVVDNSSREFNYVQPQYRSPLKAWIYKDSQTDQNEYDFFRWWRGPAQWKKLKFPSLYGEFVHSAYYARSGQGERLATWETDIPVDGLYQVFVYVPDPEDFRRGHDSGSNFGVQKYTIYHADGEDKIEIDFSKARPGWNYLETYYFKTGTAKVVLTDNSGGRMVLADAVKWELKD